jgi:hypothetical protein
MTKPERMTNAEARSATADFDAFWESDARLIRREAKEPQLIFPGIWRKSK